MPTIDENPEAHPNTKRCPHCGADIDYMNVSANYTEWGRCSGTKAIDGDYVEYEDHDCSESEENDEEFSCPECNDSLDYDFFEQEDEDDDEDETPARPPKPAPVIVNTDTNSEGEDLIDRECPECHTTFKDIADDQVDSCVKCGYVFTVNND